jgi:aspartyl-tRNA(Asn)/glutamyl-tRNA(Gln) amidotransferase subunit A
MPADLTFLTVTQALSLLQKGELAPQALTEACYRQIEHLDPLINAFITVLPPSPAGTPVQGALAGIPIAIKDLYDTQGIRTTAGTPFFDDNVPTQDAVVVKKMKDAGAVILGKTNTHEVALGVTNVNPHYGACRNPWDTARISGGSSGGSAAAVAAGMCLAALGTDTGGSIRIPASLCGVVGLKPTYGRASLRGVFPLSWNLDHAGPLARSVRDAALLLQVMAGYDPDDPASVNVPVGDYLTDIEAGVSGWRIGLAVGEYIEASDAEVLAAVRQAAQVFKNLGAKVEEVELDWLHTAALANGQMTQADGATVHRERLAQQPERFGADVRQRLETGRSLSSTEYSLARRTQVEVRRRSEGFFSRYDILLLPTTPIPAPFIEGEDAIERARLLTRFTAPFNLGGLPALSMPCGFTQEGLPVGLQIVSGAWQEAKALQAGQAYEQVSVWGQRPPLK